MMVNGLFDYTDNRFPAGSECTILLRAWHLKDGRDLVIATDLPDNKGASVTNTCETWAAEACREYSLDPAKTLFMEHYDRRPQDVTQTFDWITFTWCDGVAMEPQWRHGSKAEVEALIGEKLP